MDNPLIEITITDLSRAGAGVGRHPDGRAVFVPLTAPGDRVRVKVWKEKKKYLHADLVEILEPSPQRMSPPCPVFGRCGGCSWQHIPYTTQWETKVRGVQHALKRCGVLLPEEVYANHFDHFPAENPWNYRNRIQLRGEGNQAGYFEKASRRLVPIESCLIAREELNKTLPEIREEGSKRNLPYKVEIALTPEGRIVQAWNARHAATGFRQVNDEQNGKLQKWISDQLVTSEKKFALLDLYGGSGNLSLPLAEKVIRAHCVDLFTRTPENAPAHFEFHSSAVLPWLKRTAKRLKLSSTLSVIADPPREGLSTEGKEIIRILNDLGAQRAIAVGCDPDAWAADLLKWTNAGWTISALAVFDFFPQTPHVEAAACLSRTTEIGS